MIDIPVVLVLGAGASYPYGFPLGRGLREDALQPPNDDLLKALEGIHDALVMQLPRFQSDLQSARRTSVDAFLEARLEYKNLGKLVIAYHLIKCEYENRLYSVNSEEDWYQYLIEMMLTEGFDSFGNNTLSILTYNYDRSLEYYMFKMLKEFGKSDEACRVAMQLIPILHLHGQLGLLPELADEGRRYENKIEMKRLNLAAKGIRVVHDESLDQDPIFIKARKLLKEANCIIFLGFGYLKKNLDRLKLKENLNVKTAFHGTGVNIRPKEAEFFARLFPKRSHHHSSRKRIVIDTSATSVMDYMRNNPDLFMK